jgi:hypothetical protein
MKICSKCSELKSYSEYHKKKKSSDGLQYYCKECVKKANTKFRTIKPKYQLEWFKTNVKRWSDYCVRYHKADKTPIIYGVVNPANEVYVGMTMRFLRIRYESHKTQFKRKQRTCPLLHDSFEKYGLENHKYMVLEEYPGLTRQELKKKESEWMHKLENKVKLLNIRK